MPSGLYIASHADMRFVRHAIYLAMGSLVCGCGGTAAATSDAGQDAGVDASRVTCAAFPNDKMSDASVLCAPGEFCGNSGGVPGNRCCKVVPGCDHCCGL